MQDKISFSYLYGNEAEKFQFYRIPKTLITNDYFAHLSIEAKLLYSFMLDRAQLSSKNRDSFEEADGRIYIIYSAESIMKDIHCASAKASKIKKELIDIGLIEIKKQGLCRPDKIFVMNFESILLETPKSNLRAFENQTTGDLKCEAPGIRESNTIYTDVNETENINTESSSDDDRYMFDLILNNINIEQLQSRICSDKGKTILDAVIRAIRNVAGGLVIGTRKRPISNKDAIDSFWKLNSEHIERLIDRIEPELNSISDLVSYVEVALFREPLDKPGGRDKPRYSPGYSNERHYTSEEIEEMLRDIM